MKNNKIPNHLNNTSELYSYKLKLQAKNTILMKIDFLVKKKINHHVDIAISIRELIENLEAKKLNSIWFREKLEKKLQLKEYFSEDKKVFNDYVDEFYLEYLLKVRDLLQDQRKEVSLEEADKFDELFQIALEQAILDTVDNDHCMHEKASNEFIQLAKYQPRNQKNIILDPVISHKLLKKLDKQAKDNIALTCLFAIGKSIPSSTDKENKVVVCSRLIHTIRMLKLEYMPTLDNPNKDVDKAIAYLNDLKERKTKSSYIRPETVRTLFNFGSSSPTVR